MTEAAAKRPVFFEGQYLGADDLTALMDYFREQDARHTLGMHTWGIAIGLQLVERLTPDNELEVVLTPGFAVDGYGRQITVLAPTPLPAGSFQGLDTGEVRVWIRYDATEGQGVRRGFEVCTTDDTFKRLHESFVIEVGERGNFPDQQSGVTVNSELQNDPRLALRVAEDDAAMICDASVPQQEFLEEDDDPRWLIPLGFVHWVPATGLFQALSEEQRIRSRVLRRTTGCVAETINAANGVIRLRNRETPYDGIANPDDECAKDAMEVADLRVCDDKLRTDDLIWLEGNTRFTGDARVWGRRLEFRNERGDDYVNRTVAGLVREGIAPLMLQRVHENEIGGSDLQMLLGQDDDGKNRLVVSEVTAEGTPCETTFTPPEDRISVQSNGRVGIGTFNPTTELKSPLTIRGITDQGEIVAFEDSAGTPQWRINLGEGEANINFIESIPAGDAEGRLFLQAGGNVGISTTTPEARLDITEVQVTSGGSGLGNDMWFRVGNGDDDGRAWIEYGSQAAPLLVLSDFDNPPRIQFQQGSDLAPDHVSWIGHGTGNDPNLAMIGGNVGIGTTTPETALHIKGIDPDIFLDIDGASPNSSTELRFGTNGNHHSRLFWSKDTFKTYFQNQGDNAIVIDRDHVGMGTADPVTTLHVATGSDVGTSGSSGFLVLGSASAENVGFDNNEIQARLGSAVSTLFVQHEGGAFRVGNTKLTVQPAGDVGINTNSPECRLHVKDNISANATSVDSHVACIENTSSLDNADVLALRVGRVNPGTGNNFITFFDGAAAIGKIESNLGVFSLTGGGADFAECLPAIDASEIIQAGDVVGVQNGRVSKQTASANRVLVVTDQAIVVGNSHGDEKDHHRVALMGQVLVNVEGSVCAGDILVASGRNDGIAEAVSPDVIDNAKLGEIIGQAWETDLRTENRRINVAVNFLSGLGNTALARQLEEQAARIDALESKLVH